MLASHGAMIALMSAAFLCGMLDPGQRTVRTIVPGMVMIVSMLDIGTLHILPGMMWFAILLAAGMLCSAGLHRRPSPHRAMGVHRALVCIAMAALVLPSSGEMLATGSHHHHGGPDIGAMTALFALGLAAAGSVITARALRRRADDVQAAGAAPAARVRRRLPAWEPALMGVSVLLMLI